MQTNFSKKKPAATTHSQSSERDLKIAGPVGETAYNNNVYNGWCVSASCSGIGQWHTIIYFPTCSQRTTGTDDRPVLLLFSTPKSAWEFSPRCQLLQFGNCRNGVEKLMKVGKRGWRSQNLSISTFFTHSKEPSSNLWVHHQKPDFFLLRVPKKYLKMLNHLLHFLVSFRKKCLLTFFCS
jgi:hypothetical protein